MSEAASGLPGPIPPFTYDGKVGEEKLGELLALGAEKPYLDFKTELDLGNPTKKLDFIKDCAAMMNLPRGGYLVIGANDDGTPARNAVVPTKEMFDSAALTQIVGGYVDAPVDIRSQVHTLMLQGVQACMAVIYIAPPADGIPAVMSKAGIVPSPTGGKPIYRFHEGTVFTRLGTTNALVTHQTWRQVLSNFRDHERADARHDSDELLRRVVQGFGTTAAPSPVVPDLGMDAATFTESVRSALVQENDRIVRRFLVTAKGVYLSVASDEERTATLNRIAAVAVEALLLGDLAVVKHSIDALFELYQTHLLLPTRTEGKQHAAGRWLEIILRVMAIGAAAVRSGMYQAIPAIVLRRIGDETYSYRSWIRHGLTEASRANLFVRSDESGSGGNLIAFSAELLLENPELRPDIPLDAISESSDAFVDSLCQFDFLWCCLSLAAVGDASASAAFYPSCAAYHQHRVMPVIQKLENDAEIRGAVFGGIKDHQIANAILGVMEMAHKQSWNYGGWWSRTEDLSPNGWIRQQATETVAIRN
ncbi:ATP-binding protein [Paenarthrobacter sp. TYUT067]|uniref:AlbA family DNA-binding domain-containing protein n=1 Tax=Paenarthrobacter sp. TYUT067 TaxID=2926245 RepID=UPI0020306FF2|nr:ATP-binding protein [Paenarthrobacter sp. TYUT067]MCM0616554.1 ATP-binding protein [Paenarthrobacter sp. TYUT067]